MIEILKFEKTVKFTVFSIISLQDAAITILRTENLLDKVSLTQYYTQKWFQKEIFLITSHPTESLQTSIPSKPLRKQQEILSDDHNYVKNSITSLIHGIAHAESYAIELFWDCIARYVNFHMPQEFYNEMVMIANQEAGHFLAWYERLIELNCPYGSLWSHDGLWKSAEETQHRYYY